MELKRELGNKYASRLSAKLEYEQRQPEQIHAPRPMEEVFEGDPLEQALKISANRAQQENGQGSSEEGEEESKPEKKIKKKKKRVVTVKSKAKGLKPIVKKKMMKNK